MGTHYGGRPGGSTHVGTGSLSSPATFWALVDGLVLKGPVGAPKSGSLDNFCQQNAPYIVTWKGTTSHLLEDIMESLALKVNRIVMAFSTEARLTNLPRGHRPKVTTDFDDDRIVEAGRRNPKMTAKEIRNDLGLTASTQIVRERLHVGGFRSRVVAMKSFVSSRNRVKRLLFAQEHRSWTVEEWRNVIFTDESTFTSKWDQQQRTWRTQGTRFDAPNLHRVASNGRCSVNGGGLFPQTAWAPWYAWTAASQPQRTQTSWTLCSYHTP
ncbi:hypothetical protein HPB50_009273 [Hyalomma asiaticum]|uniref:Uncharacterized protein n=1 Tax=Hyalomma asiaticum TaxID=266040 RepID=A0ACB7RVA6_HYAAI|nr:hypothetical protein HPB50_009273 [Hyalomma asiaticum]